MNPTTPTSAMSQGATFMRPGAMAWGHPGGARPRTPSLANGGQPSAATPSHAQVDAWISAYAEPFFIRS